MGVDVGALVGAWVGVLVGAWVGALVGARVGFGVGSGDGVAAGSAVSVGSSSGNVEGIGLSEDSTVIVASAVVVLWIELLADEVISPAVVCSGSDI